MNPRTFLDEPETDGSRLRKVKKMAKLNGRWLRQTRAYHTDEDCPDQHRCVWHAR